MVFFLIYIIRTVKNTIWAGPAESNWNFDLICFLLVWIGYPFLSYASPEASFYPRVFLPIIPFVIYAAFSRISPGGDSNRNFKKLRAVTFACIILFLFFNPMQKGKGTKIPDLFALKFKLNQGQTSDPSWVFDALKYIEFTGARNPLIITSFDHFVISYYSKYEVELLWPLRKEYIDRLDRDFFIITEDSKLLRERCVTFLPEEKETCQQERAMKHFDRAALCTRIDFDRVRIYQHLRGFMHQDASER